MKDDMKEEHTCKNLSLPLGLHSYSSQVLEITVAKINLCTRSHSYLRRRNIEYLTINPSYSFMDEMRKDANTDTSSTPLTDWHKQGKLQIFHNDFTRPLDGNRELDKPLENNQSLNQ